MSALAKILVVGLLSGAAVPSHAAITADILKGKWTGSGRVDVYTKDAAGNIQAKTHCENVSATFEMTKLSKDQNAWMKISPVMNCEDPGEKKSVPGNPVVVQIDGTQLKVKLDPWGVTPEIPGIQSKVDQATNSIQAKVQTPMFTVMASMQLNEGDTIRYQNEFVDSSGKKIVLSVLLNRATN